MTIHPQERLIQEARALQASPQFGEYREKRQAAEHRIGRLIQLGVRQSRYFGQAKTLFQVMLAATVANLTLTATKTNMMRPGSGAKGISSFLSCISPAGHSRPFSLSDCPGWALGSHSSLIPPAATGFPAGLRGEGWTITRCFSVAC